MSGSTAGVGDATGPSAPPHPGPPGPTTRLPAPQRRRQLLHAALGVFSDLGYHQTSMEAVAEAAGVTKPVLYQHFGSKRELYLEVIEDVAARLMREVVGAAAGAAGPRQQVEAGFRAYFHFVHDHAGAFRLLFGGLDRDETFAAVATRVQEEMARAVAGLIDVDLADDDRHVLAHGVIGLAEGSSRRWLGRGLDLDPDALAMRVAELAWAGLRGIGRPAGA